MYLCWVLISSSTEVFANLQVNDLKLCKAPPHDNITNKALKSMEGEGGAGLGGDLSMGEGGGGSSSISPRFLSPHSSIQYKQIPLISPVPPPPLVPSLSLLSLQGLSVNC